MYNECYLSNNTAVFDRHLSTVNKGLIVSDLHVVKGAWLQRKFKKIVLNLNWQQAPTRLSRPRYNKEACTYNAITLYILGDKTTYSRIELGKSRTAIGFFNFHWSVHP